MKIYTKEIDRILLKNSWAAESIKLLLDSKTAQVRPYGRSMEPLVFSGQLVTLEPIEEDLKINDIVLVDVKGHIYLHKIISILDLLDKPVLYLIGNNRGRRNGFVKVENIFGKVTKVED